VSIADVEQWLRQEWHMVSGAPFTFFTTVGMLALLLYWLFERQYKSTISRQKVHIETLESQVNHLDKKSKTTEEREAEKLQSAIHQQPSVQPSPLVVECPKENLRIEIVSGLAGWATSNDVVIRNAVYLLLALRVTPIAGRSLSVKDVRLHTLSEDGSETPLHSVYRPNITEFSVMEQGDRYGPRGSMVEMLSKTNIARPIADGSYEILHFHAAREEISVESFMQLSFKVEITDALDGVSTTQRLPGKWLSRAQFYL
jgi:hypothetical protein